MTNKEQIQNLKLERLWNNPDDISQGKFILRFNDINEESQLLLTKRIKKIAPQKRIRLNENTTIEKIKEILILINPIIIGEISYSTNGYSYNSYPRPFSNYNTQKIDGYRFKQLCQLIFQTLYSKKLKKHQIDNIIYLTSCNYPKNSEFFTTLRNEGTYDDFLRTTAPIINIVPEIGMQELDSIGKRIDNYNNNN